MKDWSDKPVVILASGPGLTNAQCYAVACNHRNVYTITVNNTRMKYPDPDVVYAGDFLWWKIHHAAAKRDDSELWTIDANAAVRYGLNRIKGVGREGLGENVVHTGGNSGYQAINLAYLWKAKKIILLGFTMREIDGKKHWHADHEPPLIHEILPDEWRHKMTKLAADLKAKGVDVVNCDPLSALTCFRMSTIEKELS